MKIQSKDGGEMDFKEFKKIAEKKLGERFFNTRIELNKELVEYLNLKKVEEDLTKRIIELRVKYKIPKLQYEEDSIDIPYGEDQSYEDSAWLSGDKKRRACIYKDLNKVLKIYNLPFFFYGWLEFYTLYDKLLPSANSQVLPISKTDWEDLKKHPPTTQDKRQIKHLYSLMLNIKRRPPKDKSKIYNKILKYLDSLPKNKERRFRILETALKTYDAGKTIKDWDDVFEKDMYFKNTYKIIADKIDTNEKYRGIKKKKFIQKLRKQNERLKKRMSKITKKKLKR